MKTRVCDVCGRVIKKQMTSYRIRMTMRRFKWFSIEGGYYRQKSAPWDICETCWDQIKNTCKHKRESEEMKNDERK